MVHPDQSEQVPGMIERYTGSVKEAGNYEFTVNYVIDGWITKSAKYRLAVAPAFKFAEGSDDLAAAKVGQSILAQITSDVYTLNNYNTIVYSLKSGQLPAGVTISADGEISGTPTEVGRYEIVIGVEATKVTSSKKKEETTVTNDEFKTTIVVAGEEVTPVDPVEEAKAELQTKIDKLTADLAKASTKEEQTAISAQIAELQEQVKALDASSSSKATTGIVLGVVGLVLAVAACGAAGFIILKKRH